MESQKEGTMKRKSHRQDSNSIMKRLNVKGTTLLEVLIALVLFTSIAISLMRMTDTTLKYKTRITRNVKDVKFRRNIFQIIRKDIRNAFYITDINALIYSPFIIPNELVDSNEPGSPKRYTALQKKWEEFKAKEITPYIYPIVRSSGGFIGKQDSLYITSFSNLPTREDAESSDQNIVVYYLKNCRNRENNKTQSTCLWRKFSSFINQEMENLKDYKEFALLEKVKKFQLSYYSISTNEWLKEWKIGPDDRNILPSAIHITIEFEDKKKQLVKNEIKIPIYQQFILPVQRN